MSRSCPRQQKTFYYSVILIITYFLISTVSGQLTLCSQQSKNTRSLVFVSTLDGKLSALDANYGQKQWSLNFNDGPMLSSSIHDIDLDDNGQFVRLIPSLSGGLYKSDGQNIETVPILMGQLLHSLYRYSNDLVFSGGNKIHSYGISASTGEILYECRVAGCKNNTDHEEHLEQDVLIIQRFQQTMRAIEVQTGNEKWNFSVGQHDLMLVSAADVYCFDKFTAQDIEIKVVIPEGLIWAIDKNNPTVKLWQYKFDSPIVKIWREGASHSTNQRSLEQINLFDSSQWTWGLERSTINPSLYLGIYKKQLYVQENVNFLKNTLNSSKQIQHTKYPWQLYPAVVTAIVSTSPNENNKYSDKEEKAETALSVLINSEYVNGNGFYLYSKSQSDNESHKNFNTMLLIDTENTQYQVFIESIWYRWKEILIISITIAILLLTHQFLYTTRVVTKDAIIPPLIIERHIETKRSESSNDDSENINNFTSRYLTDFEPINCLGKGGYGVVFEAKNKIDDCNYAIKRIALPNSQDSRERVMREVKALAKLDHHNIVRYFNAWLECPPSGWQKEHDQQWLNKLQSLSSGFSSEITRTETKPNSSVYINVSQTDPSVDSAYDALELNKVDVNNDLSIVFENSSSKQYDNDVVCIDACSTDSSDLSSSNNATEKKLSNDHSESIVFEETDNNIVIEKDKHIRQKSISLDLNNKPNGYKSTKMFLYIQMQLCQKLSLKEWLKQNTSARNSFQILNIFQQIVDAVDYVHKQELIHRDLKPSNIFFGYDDKIKIGDFGLVTAMTENHDGGRTPEAENKNVILKDSRHTACVGTHLYMSPEQINGQNYNYKVDIYSLGIILFELLTPFFTEMERTIALSNLKKSIFPKNFAENNPAEYDLLKMMLDEDPVKRPTTCRIKTRPPLICLQNHETIDFTVDE